VSGAALGVTYFIDSENCEHGDVGVTTNAVTRIRFVGSSWVGA
jgi:hypothetical protein